MSVPSQEYIDRMAIYRSDAMGIGPRPSPYHQWIPGIGWTFMPEYDVTPYEQLNAMTGQQLSNALQQGWTHELSADSQAYADALGITVGSAPAYMGSSGGLFDNTSYANSPAATPTPPTPTPPTRTSPTPTSSVTADQVQALYQELLGRQGADQYINAWVNSGGTIDDIRQGIMNSAEYQALQSQGNGTDTDSSDDDDSDDDDSLTSAQLLGLLTAFMNSQKPAPAPVVSPSRGGSFSPSPVQRLSYSGPQVAPIGQGGQVDYVQQIRAGLVNSLFKDLV